MIIERSIRSLAFAALIFSAACGGSLPPATNTPTWTAGKSVYVDVSKQENSIAGGSRLRSALEGELRSFGLSPVSAPSLDAVSIKVKEVVRFAMIVEVDYKGRLVERLTVEPRDCMSSAWGVMEEHNFKCLARELVATLDRSAPLKTALSSSGQTGAGAPTETVTLSDPATPSEPKAAATVAPTTPDASTTTPRLVTGSPQPTAYAVVVGIERYDGLPAPTGARSDALRFVEVLKTTLGISESHIRVTLDEKATKGSIERDIEWVRSSVPPGGRIYFYYSGHGAPDASTGSSYILPVDGDPKFLKQTAIPIADVTKQLSSSKAKEVLAVLDSCFSGAGGRSVLPPGARPLVRVKDEPVASQIALFSAASGPETSGPTADGKAGLFTHYVVQGLGTGAADTDGDGQISLEELRAWVKPRVEREAKKDNRAQTPNLVVGRGLGGTSAFLVGWGFAAR